MSKAKVSDPPQIENMNELKKTTENIENCAVFPANWQEKSHFTPVYEIMKRQAEANNDEDLRKVSDIFKEHMEGKTPVSFFGGLAWVYSAMGRKMTLTVDALEYGFKHVRLRLK